MDIDANEHLDLKFIMEILLFNFYMEISYINSILFLWSPKQHTIFLKYIEESII